MKEEIVSIPKSPPKKLKTDAAPDTKKALRADKIGKQKTTPVVKTKETKSEFKKLKFLLKLYKLKHTLYN